MLSVYSNQQDLLKSTATVTANRLQQVDIDLLKPSPYSLTIEDGKPSLEVHVYTPDGVYITGNHTTDYSILSTGKQQGDITSLISIDTVNVLSNLGINRGSYKVVYNLFENIIGNYNSTKLWIKEISPSRKEVRLRFEAEDDTALQDAFITMKRIWNDMPDDAVFENYILNFGFNDTFEIVNLQFNIANGYEIVAKLYNPLSFDVNEKSKAWISKDLVDPILENVVIVSKFQESPKNTIAGPNFDIEEITGQSIATNYKTWNDLLSSNLVTSQKLVDTYFSGSLSSTKLNINYRIFDNFIHYGSAVERISNFKYKMQLIEYYNDQIQTVAAIPDVTIAAINLQDLYTKRNAIVSNFDDFEKYLFFESTSSNIYSFVDESYQSIISGSLTSIIIDPWPKITPTTYTWSQAYMLWSTAATLWTIGGDPDPYGYFSTQALTTSAAAETYYNNLLEIATMYDRYNIHKLENTIPEHIKQDEYNEEYILFVNMLGQHFDILWTYIKNLSSIHTREEHPKDGMPDSLLYQVANSMGFDLLNGKSSSELWKYALGISEDGTAITNNITEITSLTDQTTTKELWRRLVNNLPYILKSKGTSRSVKALLSCFGIPSTILTIKEYGGPSTFTEDTHYPEYVHDVFHYAWNATTGSNYLFVPTQSYISSLNPTTVEFRFKTDNNYTYSAGSTYLILSTSGSSLTLTKEAADNNEGTLTYIVNGASGSISNLEIFDNSWQQIALSKSGSTGAQLQVVKSLYGKTIYNYSASFNVSTNNYTVQENLYFASGSTKLNGHYQEIRIWSGSLNAATLEEHAASPSTYTYNVDRINSTNGSQAAEPYNRLIQRFSLSTRLINTDGSNFYQSTHQPNATITGSIYFINYTNSGSIQSDFEGFEETYYTPSPSLGGNSLYTNKVRIESSSIDGRLNTQTRVEKSSFDKFSIDSNRVGIYFSPQNAINEDIFNQLGYFEIDDYIGDPSDNYNSTYSNLNTFAINYWKKYQNRNDFEAYFRALQIYDFTLFKYIKRLIPQRANSIVGLVVEPNVLERSKVRLNKRPIIQDLSHNAVVDGKEYYTVVSDYSSIASEIIVSDTLTPAGEVPVYIKYPTTIEYTLNVNQLGSSYIQNQYINGLKYVGTSSLNTVPSSYYNGSYKPMQPIVLNSRPSVSFIEADTYLQYSTSSVTLDGSLHVASNYFDIVLPSGSYTITGVITTFNDNLYIFDGSNLVNYVADYIGSAGFQLNLTHTFSNNAIRFYNPNVLLGLIVIKGLKILSNNFAEIQDYQVGKYAPLGIKNQKYEGSKLIGPGINIDTPNTIDGGPVVKITKVNPNKIVYANNQLTTINKAVSGNQNSQISTKPKLPPNS